MEHLTIGQLPRGAGVNLQTVRLYERRELPRAYLFSASGGDEQGLLTGGGAQQP